MGMLIKFAVLLAVCLVPGAAMAAWEPEKPVELIVPASAGSSLDEMARLIQGIVVKHKLMKQPLVVLNKSGGTGAEGFFLIKRGSVNPQGKWPEIADGKLDPYQIMIADNSVFTVPLATGVPFSWKDTTPVAMLALEPFILWTNAAKGYKSAQEYMEAAKAAGPGKFKMGGSGARQEDQSLTVSMEKAAPVKFSYIPFKKGSEVAMQLVEQQVDSTLNNPIEAAASWRAGDLTPHCVFNGERLPYKDKVTKTKSWNDIPICKEAGIPIEYLSLRGVFMRPGVTPDQHAYFVGLMKRVVATPEWQGYMEQGTYSQSFLTGPAFNEWLAKMGEDHKRLMKGPCEFIC